MWLELRRTLLLLGHCPGGVGGVGAGVGAPVEAAEAGVWAVPVRLPRRPAAGLRARAGLGRPRGHCRAPAGRR